EANRAPLVAEPVRRIGRRRDVPKLRQHFSGVRGQFARRSAEGHGPRDRQVHPRYGTRDQRRHRRQKATHSRAPAERLLPVGRGLGRRRLARRQSRRQRVRSHWNYASTIFTCSRATLVHVKDKQNVTLSLSKPLLRKFRILAATRNESMTRLMSDAIQKMVEE